MDFRDFYTEVINSVFKSEPFSEDMRFQGDFKVNVCEGQVNGETRGFNLAAVEPEIEQWRPLQSRSSNTTPLESK